MRRGLFLALFLAAGIARAEGVKFVQPLDASQFVGVQLIEITTPARNVDRAEFTVDGVLVGVARTAPFRIAHDFGTALGAHRISVKVFSNGYRSIDTASVTTAALSSSESIDVDLVEVPLRAVSSRTLAASDLRVRENGVEQIVRDIRPQRSAAHFVFVVDRSLSMGDGKLAASLRAIDGELRYLRPDDTISVLLFNHNVGRIRAIARGEKLASIFGEVVPSGGTSLRDALASISSSDRTYVIVVTDGGDRNSELAEEEALRRISGTRTVVDSIVLGSRSGFLDRAARNTGGTVLEAGRDSVQRALHTLITDINSRYLLVYQSQGTKRGWRSIDVAARRRGVEILNARKGYFAR